MSDEYPLGIVAEIGSAKRLRRPFLRDTVRAGNPVARLMDRLIRALDAAWDRVDTRYANALNGAEDEL